MQVWSSDLESCFYQFTLAWKSVAGGLVLLLNVLDRYEMYDALTTHIKE